MRIAIDFDGVIMTRRGIPTSKEIWYNNKPVKGALASVKLLLSLGHEVWIFTSNPEPEIVIRWLERNKFPKLEVTNIKKPCQIIIDDRAIRFTNWQDIRKYFS